MRLRFYRQNIQINVRISYVRISGLPLTSDTKSAIIILVRTNVLAEPMSKKEMKQM